MKIWKKLSLTLCLCFAFSSVATSCDFFNNDSASSSNSSNSQQGNNNSNGNSSNNGNNNDDPIEGGDNTEAIIEIYMGLMGRTLTNSESAKLSFELVNNGSLETGIAQLDGEWTMISGEALVTKTDDGFNAKLDVKVSADETENLTYYYIDDYVYEYDAQANTYSKYNESLEEVLGNLVHSVTEGEYTLETLLASLVGGGGITGGDMSDLSYAGLEESLDGIAELDSDVTDNGMWITLDASAKANELFEFLGDVNNETTYADLLDYPLSQIDSDLTTKKIMDELLMMRDDTVRDAVEKLDEKSVAETEKTLQENLDTILDSEIVSELLASLELEASVVESIKNFEIEDFLNEESSIEKDGAFVKYSDLFMDDLAAEIVGELADILVEAGVDLEEIGFDPNDATFMMLLTVADTVLKMPALENLEEGDDLYKLLEVARTLEVSKAEGKLELVVNTTAVDHISMEATFGGNSTQKDETTVAVGATAKMKVFGFTETAIEIALPEGTVPTLIYTECAKCGEAKETVTYRETHYNYYCDECFALLPTTEPEVTE